MIYVLSAQSQKFVLKHYSCQVLKTGDLFQVLCMRWHRNGTFISSALDQTVSVWSIDDTKLKFILRYLMWMLLPSHSGETFQLFLNSSALYCNYLYKLKISKSICLRHTLWGSFVTHPYTASLNTSWWSLLYDKSVFITLLFHWRIIISSISWFFESLRHYDWCWCLHSVL